MWVVLFSVGGGGGRHPDLPTAPPPPPLAEADLVLYDALVSRAMLDLAPHAQRFYVGKRARRKAMAQDAIEALMIRSAHQGKRVVRLKCGDPFVFGRGGEEALALARAAVPFEVVPGVSSAIAAPALAGIPVTHRGVASGFVVVSGHSESAYGPILRTITPGSLTVVVLMGLAHRAAVASFLIENGWAPSTPAAMSLGASTPDASTWTGTLSALASAPELAAENDAPGTLVVGEVVSIAALIAQTVIDESAVAAGQRHA
jgi:uroporphyrin-III C-methyltransferase